MELLQSELGAFVKNRTMELGLTQKQLAQKAGLAEGFVNRIIKGDQVGSPDTLIALARALRVAPGTLLNILSGYKVPEREGFLDISHLSIFQRQQLFNYMDYLEYADREHIGGSAQVRASMSRTQARQKAQLENRLVLATITTTDDAAGEEGEPEKEPVGAGRDFSPGVHTS